MKNLIFKRGLSWVSSFNACACVAVFLCGCSATPPAAPVSAEFSAGRRVFLAQCTRCHSVRPIEKYSAEDWREILEDMSSRAKLDVTQRAQLRDYVLAVRAAAR